MKVSIQISALAGLLTLAACGAPAEVTPAGAAASTETAPSTLALHPLNPPAGPGAMAPRFSSHGDEIFLTWLQPVPDSPETDALLFSRLAGRGTAAHWTEPVEIVRGEEFFANWADNPGLRRGEDGTLVAYWLARSGAATYAYDIRLARSEDDGKTWNSAGVLHHDGVAGEHGFVSSVSDPTGMRAFWLDGREMSTEADGGHEGTGNMTLRTAVVGEEAGADQLLDERVCECCQTAAGRTASGPVVVYRDRSAEEIRDIWIVRRTGSGWSEPRPVHRDGWLVPGCPVNGPSLAVRPGHEDELVVVWFTAADASPRVLAAFSRDGGASFDQPILVDGDEPLGRVDVAWDGNGGVVVLWLSPRGEEGEADLLLHRLMPEGPAGKTFQVAATSTARHSPQQWFPPAGEAGRRDLPGLDPAPGRLHPPAGRLPASLIPAGMVRSTGRGPARPRQAAGACRCHRPGRPAVGRQAGIPRAGIQRSRPGG